MTENRPPRPPSRQIPSNPIKKPLTRSRPTNPTPARPISTFRFFEVSTFRSPFSPFQLSRYRCGPKARLHPPLAAFTLLQVSARYSNCPRAAPGRLSHPLRASVPSCLRAPPAPIWRFAAPPSHLASPTATRGRLPLNLAQCRTKVLSARTPHASTAPYSLRQFDFSAFRPPARRELLPETGSRRSVCLSGLHNSGISPAGPAPTSAPAPSNPPHPPATPALPG